MRACVSDVWCVTVPSCTPSCGVVVLLDKDARAGEPLQRYHLRICHTAVFFLAGVAVDPPNGSRTSASASLRLFHLLWHCPCHRCCSSWHGRRPVPRVVQASGWTRSKSNDASCCARLLCCSFAVAWHGQVRSFGDLLYRYCIRSTSLYMGICSSSSIFVACGISDRSPVTVHCPSCVASPCRLCFSL
jgi:hypothetical protein